MERQLRITFAIGSSVVPVAVLLVVFHDNLGADVYTVIGRIPIGVLIAIGIGEFLALSLFSAGVMFLKSRARNFALAAIIGAFLLFYGVNDLSRQALALLAPIIMLGTLSELAQREHWSWGRVILSATIVALTTTIILSLYVAAGVEGRILVISAIALQAVIAMFGLFMAATDIAEVISLAAEATGSRIAGLFRSTLPVLFLAILAIAANVSLALGQTNWSASSWGAWTGLAPWLALLAWLLLASGKRLGSVPPEIGYRGLFLVVGLYFVGFISGTLWRLFSDPQTYDPKLIFGDPQVNTPPMLLFLCFLLLFFILSGRSPGTFVVLAYATSVGMLWFHLYASRGELFVSIQRSMAIVSGLFLGASALLTSWRRQLKTMSIRVAELNLSFVVYALVLRMFFAPKGESLGFNIAGALLLLAALAWDILSSGGSITNKDTISFPRTSRVCIFLSYIVTVALLVVVSTGSHFVNVRDFGAVQDVFDSERIVGVGLMLFGPAFFFLVFVLQWRDLRISARNQKAADVQVGAAQATSSPPGWSSS